VKILAISGRFPERGGRGDQNRLFLLLEQLSKRHDVTLLTTEPGPDRRQGPGSVRSEVVECGPFDRGRSAVAAALRGQPGQTGWMMPMPAWRTALRLATEADVALVVTSRSIRGPVPGPLVIDHVDSLSFNMASRARGPESPVRRGVARFEAKRMAAWERRLAEWADVQIATSDEVAELLSASAPVAVIPAAWDGPSFEDLPGHVRDIDLIFTGDMSYPPNVEAAGRLRHEILPLVRRHRSCSTWIVGRHADRLDVPGVNTAANVPDLHAYLRRAKVAVAPVRGRGSPFKTLEAAACGAALVATRWSVACYGLEAQVAETGEEFASGILALLGDDELRFRQAAAARAAVDGHRSDRIADRFEAVLEQAASGVHRSGLG
jgi:hypothetical protein